MKDEYGFLVDILLDSDVTIHQLHAAVEETLLKGVDCAVIYMAGHGVCYSYGSYYVTHDAAAPGQPGFDLHLLQRLIQAKSAPNASVVLLLDFCHSGAVEISGMSSATPMSKAALVPVGQSFSDRRVLIAGCRASEQAAESTSIGHGYFTNSLISGLNGEAADSSGNVTVTSLYHFVDSALSLMPTQQPVMKGDIAGQIILGIGLKQGVQRAAEERLDEVVEQLRRHTAELHEHLTKCVTEQSSWERQGYYSACRFAEPILNWIEKRKLDTPGLAAKDDFRVLHQKVIECVKYLSSINTGMVIDGSQVTRRIGGGSFGSVWQLETQDGSSLAMKVFHSSDLYIEDKIKRFETGFAAMRKLSHPNIVKVHSLYRCPLSFKMDYIDGGNFRDWSYSGNDPLTVLHVLLTIGETIRHAHAFSVIHRDVKPENVIMKPSQSGDRWVPFLTDFDLAWFSTASLQTTEALGTVFYAAPEQLGKPGSSAAHSPLVDIFSFGQLMFYAITGQDPKPLDVATNTIPLRHKLGTWTIPTVAMKVLDLYEACTHRNPHERPQEMTDVCATLASIVMDIKSGAPVDNMNKDQFFEELRFAMIGLEGRQGHDEFMSSAGVTAVHCSAYSPDKITLALFLKNPVIGLANKWTTARTTLNDRVAAVMRQYPNYARYRPGVSQPYEVFLDFPPIRCGRDDVLRVREVLAKVIDKIESFS
jgi:serine/threonine protein kinase